MIERVTIEEGRRLLASVRPRRAKGPIDWSEVLLQQIRAKRLPEPVREYRFDARGLRRWRFDLAWLPEMVALELNGSEWQQGRHNRGAGMASDCEKINTATLQGWAVFVFVGSQVRSGMALDVLSKVLA